MLGAWRGTEIFHHLSDCLPSYLINEMCASMNLKWRNIFSPPRQPPDLPKWKQMDSVDMKLSSSGSSKRPKPLKALKANFKIYNLKTPIYPWHLMTLYLSRQQCGFGLLLLCKLEETFWKKPSGCCSSELGAGMWAGQSLSGQGWRLGCSTL